MARSNPYTGRFDRHRSVHTSRINMGGKYRVPKSSQESSDKTYLLLVGASSAIGCEVIRHVSDENVVVLAHYRSGLDRLMSVQEKIPSQMIPIPADLSSEEGVEMLVKSVEEHCDAPQKIVFLAAPALVMTRFKELTWQDFQSQLDIQLAASVRLLGRFLPIMARARYGRIVFVLSSCTHG